MAFALAVGCAGAQDFKAAQACTRLDDDAARLSCYDAALGVAKRPTASQSAAVGKPDAEAMFGDDGRLHPEAKANLPKRLTAQVRQLRMLPSEMYQLTLDNGQVWHTTEADSLLTFKVDDAVTISRLPLGSYVISLKNRATSVKAVRVK